MHRWIRTIFYAYRSTSGDRCYTMWNMRNDTVTKSIIQMYTIMNAVELPVRMISTARFSVGKLLLHHYKSDLAHISDMYSSVIELYLSEMRAKNN